MLTAFSESALLNWILGDPFPAPPTGESGDEGAQRGAWLSLHHSYVCDHTDQVNGWDGGDRIRLLSTDFGRLEDGGIANTRALLFGSHQSPQHLEGFGIWIGYNGMTQILSGHLKASMDLAPGNPPLFFCGDLKLKLR